MGHVLDVLELAARMAVRGLRPVDLAEKAHLAPATISHALAGRPVSAGTLRAIAIALSESAPIPGADGLLAGLQTAGDRGAAGAVAEADHKGAASGPTRETAQGGSRGGRIPRRA
jgi:hypothetical protein